jgi:hypothetical protein
MRRRVWEVLAVVALVWLLAPMLLGGGGNGVEMGNGPINPALSDQPPADPPCVSSHTYDYRSWPGFQTLRSDVWVTGCKDATGQLRVFSGPTCRATSFLGPGTATCRAVSEGDHLKVTVHITYPFFLDSLNGRPSTTAFALRSGSWTAVAP